VLCCVVSSFRVIIPTDIRTDVKEIKLSRLYRLNPLGEGMLYASSGRGPFLGLPRVVRTGVFKVVVCCVVTGAVGSTGGKVNWPAWTCSVPRRRTVALVSARRGRGLFVAQ